MKKFVFAALLLVSFASDDQAQAQSANHYIRQQERTDPGYNGRPAGYFGGSSYYGGSYDAVPLSALPCFLFCSNGSRKPKNGELRTLADGTSVSYDKASNRWVVVNQPSTQPRGVYVDRDVYVAQ